MANVIDVHIHFGAPGQNGAAVNGCYWSPSFEKTAAYWSFRLITGTLCGKVDFDRAKKKMFEVVHGSTKVDQCVFLALDQVYDEDGNTNLSEWTSLYTDNRAIVALRDAYQAAYPGDNQKILFGASIHPYRIDWKKELNYCLENKAVLCKWVPSAQCIDPNNPKCIDFYQALASRNLPLLCHVGPELSIPTTNRNSSIDYKQFDNAKHLRTALSLGVTVIFTHGSLPFWPANLGDDDPYQQFRMIMNEAKSNGYGDQWKAYADISAVSLGRGPYVPQLRDDAGDSRLIFGSDYPIPMIDLPHKEVPSICDWIKHFWETLTAKNDLDKNYLILESMGFPPEVFTAAEKLFANINYSPVL